MNTAQRLRDAVAQIHNGPFPLAELLPLMEKAAGELEAQAAPVPDLAALVRKVHAAKGRHHNQLAMCDLYDAVGLPCVRPGQDPEQMMSDSIAREEQEP